jgi:hypothetical protein
MTTKDATEIGKAVCAVRCTTRWAGIRALAGRLESPTGRPFLEWCSIGAVAVTLLTFGMSVTKADGSGDANVIKNNDGKHYDKAGNPTFNIGSDGTVDWYT